MPPRFGAGPTPSPGGISWGGAWEGVKPYIPAAIGAGGQVVGDIITARGQDRTNAQNADQAKKQQDFQERMSNSEWQRAVNDMRAAGLNPALAYEKGGASTPSGASAVMQNSAAAYKGSAAGAAATMTQLQTAAATKNQIEANTRNTDAQTNQIRLESAERLRDLYLRNTMAGTNANYLETQIRKGLEAQQGGINRMSLDNSFLEKTLQTRVEQSGADFSDTMASIRDKNARSLLAELSAPEARAQAASWATPWGRHFRPYMNDARSLTTLFGPLKLNPSGREMK